MTFAARQRLGSYELHSPLVCDGAGECYHARKVGASGEAFVRILARQWTLEPAQFPVFDRQVEAMRRFEHPGVARLFEIDAQEGVLYAASEWLEGETMRQKLSKGRLLPHKAAGYAVQIAHALAAAHAAGLMHADLKPENILVTKDGRVKIRDFGLANLGYSESESIPGELVVDYAAPEQVRGERETAQSDIFSLGVVLYEMLSGVRPFLRTSLVATTGAILSDALPELPPAVAPALVRIVEVCVAKDARQRFHSAADVAIAIESFGTMIAPLERMRHMEHRRFPGVLLAVLAGLFLGACAGVLLARKLLRPVAAAPLIFRQVTSSGHDFSPTSSANGKTVAFRSDRDGASRIWTLQVENGREAPLTTGPDFHPRLNDRGDAVLFIRQDTSGDNLYAVPSAGGIPRKLLNRVDGADLVARPWHRVVARRAPGRRGGERHRRARDSPRRRGSAPLSAGLARRQTGSGHIQKGHFHCETGWFRPAICIAASPRRRGSFRCSLDAR